MYNSAEMAASRSKEKINIYISTFLLVYISSGYSVLAKQGTVVLLYCLGLFAYIVFTNIYALNKIRFMPVVCLAIAVISYIVNGEDSKQTTILISFFCLAIIFSSAYSAERWCRAYVRVMSLIAVCSLGLYVITMAAPSVINILPKVTNSKGLEKGTVFFAVTPTENRNYGCFWEPGAFQTYILLAFIIEVFKLNAESKKRIAILLLTLVTTFSTAGYAAMVIAIVAVMMSGVTNSALGKNTRRIIILALIAGAVSYYIIKNVYPQLYYTLFGKLEDYGTNKTENSSTGVRMNSIIDVFKVYAENPVFGVGNTEMKRLFKDMYGHSMVTCTYANWFAYFGTLFGCLMIYGLFMFTRFFTDRAPVRIVLFLAIMASITSEDYVMNPSILILIFYGFQAMGKYRKSDLEEHYV